MSDASVAAALRSPCRLVVVEAPGGCGKTHQGADYAKAICKQIAPGRLLILAHTHAACDVFADRTRGLAKYVEIRTIDSLASEISTAYPPSSGMNELDFDATTRRAARILKQIPFLAQGLARRYPIVICDEHQDASSDQHEIIMALHAEGVLLRVFGDPMQLIYTADGKHQNLPDDLARWEALRTAADLAVRLETPHRWRNGNEELGKWVLRSREDLAAGRPIDLTAMRPKAVKIIEGDNLSPRNLGFMLDKSIQKHLSHVVRTTRPLLVLSAHRKTCQAVRSVFGRRLPIWEGHSRPALDNLTVALKKIDNVADIGNVTIALCQELCTGFSDSQFANILRAEIAADSRRTTRGKREVMQRLARILIERPDYRGVATFLKELRVAIRNEDSFKTIKIDYPHEFWEASSLADYDDLQAALTAIAMRRSSNRHLLPKQTISTIHKAKGLEQENVLILPCDAKTFPEKNRRLLYVALSRATQSLTLVVSRTNPTPLFSF